MVKFDAIQRKFKIFIENSLALRSSIKPSSLLDYCSVFENLQKIDQKMKKKIGQN